MYNNLTITMDEFLDIICYPYLYLYVKTRVYVHQGKIHYLSWIVDMRKHYKAKLYSY